MFINGRLLTSTWRLLFIVLIQYLLIHTTVTADTCPVPQDKLVISGSDTMRPLVQAWADAFKQGSPIKIKIVSRGSGIAIPKLIRCKTDIGAMSRAPNAEEIAKFKKRFGYAPTIVEVAIDAIGIYVHIDNPIVYTTIPKIDATYSSTRKCGLIFNLNKWQDLNEQSHSLEPIILFGRDQYSGSREFFRQIALCEGDYKPNIKEFKDSAALVAEIAKNRFAIGYAGMAYMTDQLKTKVKMLKIATQNGEAFVAPTPENARNKSYALSRPLYLVLNQAPGTKLTGAVKTFMEFVQSTEGCRIAQKVGYVSASKCQLPQCKDLPVYIEIMRKITRQLLSALNAQDMALIRISIQELKTVFEAINDNSCVLNN